MGSLGDRTALITGMSGCAAVFHAAAKVGLWGDWEEFMEGTVRGTGHVIAATRQARVPRLIHVSSEAVLAGGKELLNVDETAPLPRKPNGAYPRSKGMAEQAVLAANGAGLATVVVRPRFIWGRGDTTLLPQLTKAMRDGQWAWFGPDHPMSTCNIRNASQGTILAAQYGRGGEVYFLCDGAPVAFRPFISALVETQGVQAGGMQLPLWVADAGAALCESAWTILRLKGEPPLTRTSVNLFFRQVTVNGDKARRELGYVPVVSVEEGLQELRAATPETAMNDPLHA